MEFIRIREAWIPMQDPQFRLEEWDWQDRTDGLPSDDAFYVVSTTKGVELLNTPDWSTIVSYLTAVLGEDGVLDDFSGGSGIVWTEG